MTSLFLLGPRAAIVVWWLLQPLRWQTAFHGAFVWPVLGFVFLPFTTLAYVAVAPTGAVAGTAWGLVVIGLIVDLVGYASGGYGNRGRARGYSR